MPATNRPATLERCLDAIRSAVDGPDELLVVEEPANEGPAAARNAGAARATGDVVVFVDADVEVHPDAFARVRAAFVDPSLVALFGSYDGDPPRSGVVSDFRNLLHHHVHQSAPGEAATFWAGLGAVRRESFLAANGFDGERFPLPSIEDIDLGMRLVASGGRIELDPALQGTHLKVWGLWDMIRTDFARRGVPWVALVLRTRAGGTALNLGWRHRASAVASLLVVGSLAVRRPLPGLAAAAALVALNHSFYGLLLERRGPRHAFLGVGLHVLHHLTSVAAVPAGVVAYLRDRG